jgi:hypothetical protein
VVERDLPDALIVEVGYKHDSLLPALAAQKTVV